jgi:IS30 family transposase
MNLQPAAQAEPERRTRSKLERHREAILTLRRKHWTYRQIARWLNEHGVAVTFPAVYRFCERTISRRPRSAGAIAATPNILESQPLSIPQTTATQTRSEPKKHRFNIEEL